MVKTTQNSNHTWSAIFCVIVYWLYVSALLKYQSWISGLNISWIILIQGCWLLSGFLYGASLKNEQFDF